MYSYEERIRAVKLYSNWEAHRRNYSSVGLPDEELSEEMA